MSNVRELIAAFQEINTNSRNVAHFTPGLVGMFGSIALMNDFLADLDEAISSGSIPEPLKARARNLTRTYIPQIAGLNCITDFSGQVVSADMLRSIDSHSPESRGEGVTIILAALVQILNDCCKSS